ncbi:TUTase nucleotidyltransferase domain [Dillenia turbinata]|uniref:RNA uridylyltransferase n=1 Tax=Dillenia turbinata TaxID=194707 RepID=A0AAN8UVL4_9MAGN
MPGGGGDAQPQPENGGEFLLQLLQKPKPKPNPSSEPQSHSPSSSSNQFLAHDPAVAAVGAALPFNLPSPSPSPPWPSSNGRDLSSSPWPSSAVAGAPDLYFHGFPQNPWLPSPTQGFTPPNSGPPQYHHNINNFLNDDFQKLGFGLGFRGNSPNQLEHQPKLMFGSMPCDFRIRPAVLPNTGHPLGSPSVDNRGFPVNSGILKDPSGPKTALDRVFDPNGNRHLNHERDSRGGSRGRRGSGVFHGTERLKDVRPPPPGFPARPNGDHEEDFGTRRHIVGQNVDKDKKGCSELRQGNYRSDRSSEDNQRVHKLMYGHLRNDGREGLHLGLSRQIEQPGPPSGSNLHSARASDIEESLLNLHADVGAEHGFHPVEEKMRRDNDSGNEYDQHELDELGEQLIESLELGDGAANKSDRKLGRSAREKDVRSDTRGKQILSQRLRMMKSKMPCRIDINRLNAPLLKIYESLIPAEEEKVKQKQLLTMLEKIVSKEWPNAKLFLYGSCANSFGVSKSDIDVCLAIEDEGIDKSEVLLKLAELLQSDNLQNVQALTRARVPIVKLMDPVTGISCDICINNVLAVINTKLLRDYSKIDVRLHQLAFIVKHWAKSRGVNATYQGTLSSYAYVLMCIHFLQQRIPAILPCLQVLETTYKVTVDDIECAYFDQVDSLVDFGAQNKECIAQLVWKFFNYWAYCHDYANSVISVRTGRILSKQDKDWTRRVGNDRHLICIEDPFETSHDLGRVVDRSSVRVLREEFERAAQIMQFDPNPCESLFEPYVRC